MTSKDNTSKALSNISKRPNTRNHSKKTQSSKFMPPFEITKNISVVDEQISSSKHSSEKMFHQNIMSVMVAGMDTSEVRMTELEKKDNPEQHVTHFTKTCETGSMRGDLLIKQFIRNLKGNTFNCFYPPSYPNPLHSSSIQQNTDEITKATNDGGNDNEIYSVAKAETSSSRRHYRRVSGGDRKEQDGVFRR
ncbi:ty3-gypsy retrotransposon protein [Cucumis melo var. makuwa]|uniref:Ty3-gypsy retrotransposon protein n=1 Tax=Cucumis melo var. makuwa TaxID=1194695 RepID=A0A5D3C2S2_CUCMM|nr:ty3-gypsy retrotransposon protein [Cucumis melo var. makuwa]